MDTAALLFGGMSTAAPKGSSGGGGSGGGGKGGSQLPRRYKCKYEGCGKAFTKVSAEVDVGSEGIDWIGAR
jgi:hypothetical protein